MPESEGSKEEYEGEESNEEIYLVTDDKGLVLGVYDSIGRATLTTVSKNRKVTKYEINKESSALAKVTLPLPCWKVVGLFFLLPIFIAYVTFVEIEDQRLVIKALNVTSDPIAWFPAKSKGPGHFLRESEQLKAYHPVVFIPGIVSSGLEVWAGQKCATKNFRERFWGQASMLQKILTDRKCWMKHMSLDQSTWNDPRNIKLRAAQGLSAADFFVTGYYVWGKVIEAFAAVGYEENVNMYMASYDWRLPCKIMEDRDKYFTRLRAQIELMYKMNEQHRVVVIGHSMGASVWLYFQSWVTSAHQSGGNGGKDWVEKYIESFVNIGGALLGAPKTLPTVLSGEMRDTAEMGHIGRLLQPSLFPKKDIVGFFRSLGSLPMLFPKDWSRPVFHFNTTGLFNADDALGTLFPQEVPEYMELVSQYYELNAIGKKLSKAGVNPKWWSNTLLSPLARAKTTKIYCLYGVGKPTEVAYKYSDPPHAAVDFQNNANGFKNGVLNEDGDGTVPLRSLGLVCASSHGWNGTTPLNPGGSPVVLKEYKHKPMFGLLQGGGKSADHVDIMGNTELLQDLVRIVTKKTSPKVKNRIYSNILQEAKAHKGWGTVSEAWYQLW